MAFCIPECVEFDDSFTDSDSDYGDAVWSDDESNSSASQLSVHHPDSTVNPLQPSELSVKDIFVSINPTDTDKSVYTGPMDPCLVVLRECQVCFCMGHLVCLPCCGFRLCKNCFESYIDVKVQLGMEEIECPNTCDSPLDPHYIVNILPLKYQLAKIQPPPSSLDACSCCGNLKFFKEDVPNSERKKMICSRCGLVSCGSCFMRWHRGVSCVQSQNGDKLLKSWAKGYLAGQPKAQKCPKCKIYIERITGCNSICCTKCGTTFCYRCGEAFRSCKAFGDHSSKYSVFGCKYAFLPDKPLYRKFIRGSLFSTRVVAAVTIGTLAIGVGSAAVCVGAAALPFYGAVRMYLKLKRKRKSSIPESVGPVSLTSNCCLIKFKKKNNYSEIEQERKYLKDPDSTSPESQTEDQSNESTFHKDSTRNSTIKDVGEWITRNKKTPKISHPDEESEGIDTNESKNEELGSGSKSE